MITGAVFLAAAAFAGRCPFVRAAGGAAGSASTAEAPPAPAADSSPEAGSAAGSSSPSAPAAGMRQARAALREDLSRLRKTPDDDALREDIIRLALKVRPPLPKEAGRRMDGGAQIVGSARTPRDFKAAADEFAAAALAAPWHADAYRSLGMALDAAGEYAGAARNLKLYLLARPDAPDLVRVRVLIDRLEHRPPPSPAAASVAGPSGAPDSSPAALTPELRQARMVAAAKKMLTSGTWCTESNRSKCAVGPRNAFGDGTGVWVSIAVDGDSFRLVRENDAGLRATYEGMMTRLGVSGSCSVEEWTTGKILTPSSACSFDAVVGPDGRIVQMTSTDRSGLSAWTYTRRE